MSRPAPPLTSPLAPAITRFIAHKRVLGRRFDTEAGTLRLLDRYLVAQGIATVAEITPAVIDAFLRSRPRPRPRSFNQLRGVLAGFFRWAVSRTVLPVSLLQTPGRPARGGRIPCIFTPDQLRQLVEAAARLRDVPGATDRGVTYRLLFLVLYTLGLRVSEACRLTMADLDRPRQLLVIRGAKFGKERLVPFGPRLGRLLEQHVALRRQRRGARARDAPLFSVRAGRAVNRHSVDRVFRQLLPHVSGPFPPEAGSPRVHDLRHACAVAALLRWYRTGVDPATRLLPLSTFLGHVQPESTAVYLTITADLLAEASRRFQPPAAVAVGEREP